MVYEVIFPNLQAIPWGALIIAFLGGFFVARKFPAILPTIFQPQPSQADLIAEIVKQLKG